MTERLVRRLARRGPESLVRPGAAALLAVVLAAALVAWTWLMRSGGEAALSTGDAIRLALIGVPVMLLAAWAGLLAARRALSVPGTAPGTALATAVTVAVAGAVAAVVWAVVLASAPLFIGTPGGTLAPLLAGMRDMLASLPVAVLASALVLVPMARRRPWDAPDTSGWRAPSRRAGRLATGAAALALVLAPALIVAQSGAERARAAGAPAPCPSGAAIRTFHVSAEDVDIPLNRLGDHDAEGAMYVLRDDPSTPATDEDQLDDVQAQLALPADRRVSLGQNGHDAIQPLVIRANLGDCVRVTFENNLAAATDVGMHVDGLAFDVTSSGDAVGQNPSSAVAGGVGGGTITYTWYVPEDPALEGAHYIRPGPGNRNLVSHGLFGALVVEPPGSRYLDPADNTQEISSGWEAIIDVPAPAKDFREAINIFHEVGDERYEITTTSAEYAPLLPMKDPHTTAYRPGSRAINYRSEPFMHRLDREDRWKAYAYSSYTFGDPTTPMPRGYLGDPTKIRVVHGGSEMLHVYHLHGGGIRWRQNPLADGTFSYQDTGLDKHPKTTLSPSSRLDSQSIGPGESYNLEIEGGAGGVQQSAGDFLFHCHIAEHYVAGMWSFWRVFDTQRPELAPLPDRQAPPAPVTSAELIGRTYNGVEITAANLDQWVRPQLPAQGEPDRDTTNPLAPGGTDVEGVVWDWDVTTDGSGDPLYVGAPLNTEGWVNLPTQQEAGQGASDTARTPLLPGDQVAAGRPVILFNPQNGRPTYPLLRPDVGNRIPFSPRHGGAPWLSARADDAPQAGTPSPMAGRADALCPTGAQLRTYNAVSIQRSVRVTRAGQTDPFGKVFVLARDKGAVLSGQKPVEPLAIRANSGDCVRVTLTSEQIDDTTPLAEIPPGVSQPDPDQPFSMTNMHIHHVQFDVQASDGVGTGLAFGQAVRPYKSEDPRLTQAAAAGDTVLHLSAVPAKLRPGVTIAVGLGTEDIEVHEIASVDAGAGTVTLTGGLARAHAAGRWAGTEFIEYLWYPDVVLDNVFFHDHVDGIKNWGHGLVGQLLVEPPGSTWHDPVTGEQVDSGTFVDIRTQSPLIPGVVDGSFREMVMWTIDENPATDSTINLRAEPWGSRLTANPDPSLLLSSYTHGDPFTPLPRTYAGDPFVIRTINVGPTTDGLRVDGHRFAVESRFTEAGRQTASATDAVTYGVSEKFSLIFQGGAGGPLARPGDYLYENTIARRARQGAWGLIRVLPSRVPDLQPLPGRTPPSDPVTPPSQTGGRPPVASGPGEPCSPGRPLREFAVSAVDVPAPVPPAVGPTAAFVPSDLADDVIAGRRDPDPLVLHAAAGDCVSITFTNRRASARASLAMGEVLRDPRSSGVNAGFTPEQTVAPGQTRVYRYLADTDRVGSVPLRDAGGLDTGTEGLYGALVVAPEGAWFTDPVSGRRADTGVSVDVWTPDGGAYRDFTLTMFDDDPFIGGASTPYNTLVEGPALFNYRAEPLVTGGNLADTGNAFARDPQTALLRAHRGDPVRVHFISAGGSEQQKVVSLGGLTWPADPNIPRSNALTAQTISPLNTVDAHVRGGAGGATQTVGDFFVGDLRRPFTAAGMWGVMRVLPAASGCGPVRPLAGAPGCARPEAPVLPTVPAPDPPAQPEPTPPPPPVVVQQQADPLPATPRRLTRAGLPSRMALSTARRRGIPVTVRPDWSTRSVRLSLRRAGGPVLVTATFRLRRLTPRAGQDPPPVTLRIKPKRVARLRAGLHVVTIRMPGFPVLTGRVTLVGPRGGR